MRELCLYNLEQAAVIVLDDSGMQYFFNCGRAGAIQSRATGFLVPLSNDPPADQPELALAGRLSALVGDNGGLGPADATNINELLRELSSTDICFVNEARLPESCESRVYVIVRPQGEYSQFQGLDEFEALLVWPVSNIPGL
ncbi:hypothetical protein FT643_16985 [Ketobacter sp. MCCC 1A13808]|uniref:DUF6210 family protein n=1 Tax=Ketobacter sp. MCCC 1A13808 TaxID=2602738 RepID=UPI0012EB167E|nr:DUF6210 family protein [Ketobacter sp. MCCC 1A13808]MVF13839.1 hypothetical protein [Ketobacter sp. MCCC 1A13808]